jgi:competence protein ComEC
MGRLPHPEVMKRYEGLDITVFRTDRDGAVTVTTDGNNIEIKPFLRETNAQD